MHSFANDGPTRRPVVIAALALLAAVGALIGGARPAAAFTDEDLYGPPAAPLGYRMDLGFRNTWVTGDGIDPFAPSRSLDQLSLSAQTRLAGTPGSAGGLLVGIAWDYGSADSQARAAFTSLSLHRLTVPIQLQKAVLSRLALFARVAPGFAHQSISVSDGSAPDAPFAMMGGAPLTDAAWTLAGDAGAGATFRFGGLHRRNTPRFEFWLTAEGGYSWTAARDMVLSRRGEQQAGRTDEPLRLGRLAPSGPYLRMALGMSF